MKKHHPQNERIKRAYFIYLHEAKRNSEDTVDAVAKAIARFELYTGYKDFKVFRFDQAVAFKHHLAEQPGERAGSKLAKSTVHATLAHLKRFFQWLAGQPGYKSRFSYSDADYFNLTENEVRVATTKRDPAGPTLEQVKSVISLMPADTGLERRNRAVIALALRTSCTNTSITR